MDIAITGRELIYASNAYDASLHLTPIEHRILDMQKKGKTAAEIANALDLSLTEVANRIEAISKKFQSPTIKADNPRLNKSSL